MTWESGGEQVRAKHVYHDFIAALDKFSSLNFAWNTEAWAIMKQFSENTMALINLGFAGNVDALDRAEAKVREIESAYHMAPAKFKLPIQTETKVVHVSDNRGLEVQRLLQAIQPPTGWKKYRDLILTSAVSAIVTAVVTVLVLHYLG